MTMPDPTPRVLFDSKEPFLVRIEEESHGEHRTFIYICDEAAWEPGQHTYIVVHRLLRAIGERDAEIERLRKDFQEANADKSQLAVALRYALGNIDLMNVGAPSVQQPKLPPHLRFADIFCKRCNEPTDNWVNGVCQGCGWVHDALPKDFHKPKEIPGAQS